MTTGELAAIGLKRSLGLFHMLVDDLTVSDFTHVPVPGANTALWIVGHLASSEHRMLGFLTDEHPSAPDEQMIARYRPGTKYDPQTNKDDPYELIKLFDAMRGRSIDVVSAMPAQHFFHKLNPPHARFESIGELVAMMSIHLAMHTGHLSTIRRSLGKPAVF